MAHTIMPNIATRIIIRSGGQTGVDRAAIEFALKHEITYLGWCPRGGLAEDFQSPPGLLSRYPHLSETPSERSEQRTAWNVRDSEATLLMDSHQDENGSPGSAFTKLCAELIFGKPWYEAHLAEDVATSQIRGWLQTCIALAKKERFCLNVAGPRESECPGIYDRALAWLESVFHEW